MIRKNCSIPVVVEGLFCFLITELSGKLLTFFHFFFFVFQAANPNKVSDDLIESYRDDLRAGRSVNSDKELKDFCTDSNFKVRTRKAKILAIPR